MQNAFIQRRFDLEHVNFALCVYKFHNLYLHWCTPFWHRRDKIVIFISKEIVTNVKCLFYNIHLQIYPPTTFCFYRKYDESEMIFLPFLLQLETYNVTF